MKTADRLKRAGKELMKLNVGNAIKSVLVGEFSSVEGPSGWQFLDDGREVYFEYTSNNSSLKAYKKCPPFAAVINKKTQAFTNGKTWLLDKSTEEEAKGEVAGRLKVLLAKPNVLQNWRQFEAQNYIYQQISGYCVVLPIKPVGFDNTYTTAIWNIPPHMLEIREKKDVNFITAKKVSDIIESVELKWGGHRKLLPLDDIYIFKDFTPSISSIVIPESRARSLEQPINNIIGAYESRGILIDKRGPSFVISSDATDNDGNIPLTAKEKADIEEDFKKYGLRKKQIQAIITSAAVKLQTVGFSTRELMLFEEIEDDIMRICDQYGMPHRLVASSRGNSLGGSDAGHFNTQLYQDTILPESLSFYEQWDQFFGLEKYKLTLNKDYSHVAALQGDKVKDATARKMLNEALKIEFEMGLITLDQWLQKLGEDPLPKGAGNVRVSDLKNSNVALAVTIGVGGVQSLISLITAKGMTEEAKKNTIEIIFGIAPNDAARMVVGSDEQNSSSGNNQGNNNSNSSNGNSGN